jgi:hypothetical protein
MLIASPERRLIEMPGKFAERLSSRSFSRSISWQIVTSGAAKTEILAGVQTNSTAAVAQAAATRVGRANIVTRTTTGGEGDRHSKEGRVPMTSLRVCQKRTVKVSIFSIPVMTLTSTNVNSAVTVMARSLLGHTVASMNEGIPTSINTIRVGRPDTAMADRTVKIAPVGIRPRVNTVPGKVGIEAMAVTNTVGGHQITRVGAQKIISDRMSG